MEIIESTVTRDSLAKFQQVPINKKRLRRPLKPQSLPVFGSWSVVVELIIKKEGREKGKKGREERGKKREEKRKERREKDK